jgi:hypothetical protein
MKITRVYVQASKIDMIKTKLVVPRRSKLTLKISFFLNNWKGRKQEKKGTSPNQSLQCQEHNPSSPFHTPSSLNWPGCLFSGIYNTIKSVRRFQNNELKLRKITKRLDTVDRERH